MSEEELNSGLIWEGKPKKVSENYNEEVWTQEDIDAINKRFNELCELFGEDME